MRGKDLVPETHRFQFLFKTREEWQVQRVNGSKIKLPNAYVHFGFTGGAGLYLAEGEQTPHSGCVKDSLH